MYTERVYDRHVQRAIYLLFLITGSIQPSGTKLYGCFDFRARRARPVATHIYTATMHILFQTQVKAYNLLSERRPLFYFDQLQFDGRASPSLWQIQTHHHIHTQQSPSLYTFFFFSNERIDPHLTHNIPVQFLSYCFSSIFKGYFFPFTFLFYFQGGALSGKSMQLCVCGCVSIVTMGVFIFFMLLPIQMGCMDLFVFTLLLQVCQLTLYIFFLFQFGGENAALGLVLGWTVRHGLSSFSLAVRLS